MVMASSISSRACIETARDRMDMAGGKVAAGQDRLGINLLGDRNGLVRLSERAIEVVPPR